MSATRKPPTLLCVANFPSNTGFAWDFIEGLYAGVADRLAPEGIRTLVAYPELKDAPRTLEGSAAVAIERPFSLRSPAGIRDAVRLVRSENVRTLYLSDRSTWSPAYPLLRAAGVRRIVVHDHTSGHRTVPRGLKKLGKKATRRIPGTVADVVIAVSEYVGRRKVEVDLVPPARVEVVPNSVPLDTPKPERTLREVFEIAPDRLIVVCACRAAPEKGVHHLLRAFDRMLTTWEDGPRPVLVYMGDGPFLPELRALRSTIDGSDDVIIAGYRRDASALVGSADLAVVPSTWEEAFGLAALEPMVHGVPVVASAVGGIPEVVEHGETGLLTPPGNEAELAATMRRLLMDPSERRRLGAQGLERSRRFDMAAELTTLAALLKP